MLNLEIISPEKIIFQGEVAMATLPGEEGEFGVLPNHQPLIAQLKGGEIFIYDKTDGSKPVKTYSIDGGFAETDGKKCIVLSDYISVVDELHPPHAHGDASHSRSDAEKTFLKSNKK